MAWLKIPADRRFFRIRQIGRGDIAEMKLKTQDYNDLTVVELQGELTADFVDMLKNTMTEHCCQKESLALCSI